MNPSDVLSPEIVDLGLAIGLLKQSGGPVEFDSDWFSDPGPRVTQALADDDRRAALVRFVDAVNGPSDATRTGGVTLVKVFDASELGIADAPRLVVNVAIDDSSDTYVEVGVAITHSTTGPETHTDLVVPLYRTGKRLGSELATVPEPFALAAGSPIRLQSTLSLGSGEPDASGFGLRGVAVTVNVPFTGAEVGVEIDLQGLRLPGSTAPVDIQIGGDGASLEHALLSLVIGAVRAAAAALGSAGHAALAALDLIGLGSDPALPALDLSQLAAEGVAALRSWFAEAMADQTRRRAWLDALGTVIGGTRSGDVLAVALGGGPVNLELSVAAAVGTGGHLRVTPRVGLELSTLIGAGAGAVRLRAEGSIEAMTVDLADGAVTPIPSAELHVTLEGNGARLLDTGPIRIGSAELGIALKAGVVVPLVRLLDVVVEGTPHEVVDLSSADAVVAAAGNVASDLLVAAIDAFGDAAPHLKALLGLVPPVGMDPLDAGQLLVNPPGALAAWWHALLFDHADLVAGVLEHLRDLLAHDSVLVMPVSGSGTAASPWSLRLVDRVSLDAWLDGSTFVVAVTLGSRVDTLAGGCTVVNVAARAELLALDLEAGHASLLRGASLTASLRGRGMTEARLSLGPVAVVADSLGVAARWSAAAGFSVSLEAPNLAADLGDDQRVPLALPLGATWQTSVFADVESLVGVLGATNPSGWLHDLVDLLGWTFGSEESPHKLHLAGLATDAAAELRTWAQKLATDERVVSRVTSALARVLTGSTDGRAGALTGTGKPRDPWVLPLGVGADAPALSLSLGPDGPRLDPSTTGDALRTWRPGLPGLGAAGLAQAVFDEARAGDDVAALSFARAGLGTGLEALVERVVGTDVLVSAPPSPPAPPAGVDVVIEPAWAYPRWAGMSADEALGAPPAAGAAVVRVAIGTASDHPFDSPPPGRVLDLSTPSLTPESFTVAAPAPGEWFVVLATRADATLGVADPSGVLGQAARLRRVIAALGADRPVVLLAIGGAGHAARLAADAEASVTHLVTLGTPWSAVSFDSARNGVSADALRLLGALLPAADSAEPDDADLAVGRALVEGLRSARLQLELEAPRPEVAVRAGLTVRAWFGGLDRAAVERGLTAVVAAGLAARARDRAPESTASAVDAHLSFRVPIPALPPPAGHGVVLEASVELGLVGSVFADQTVQARPSVKVRLAIADSDSGATGAWLIGGPGTVPAAGADPLEVRFVEATVEIGLSGGPSRVELVLHEVSALGAYRDRLVVRPDPLATGATEDLPFLPEARAVLNAMVSRLRAADPASAAARLVELLDGIGLTTAIGLVPDALSHLLHDPVAFVAPLLSAAPGRDALAAALAALVDGASRTGDRVTITRGPATVSLELGARRAGITAAASEGVLPWSIDVQNLGGVPTGSVTLGDASFNAGAVRFDFAPFTVGFVRATATGEPTRVSLWPAPDIDSLAAFAVTALPAEAVRLILEAIRGIDATVAVVIDGFASALGVLGAADAHGHRRIVAPVGLFTDPGGWFRHHVLDVAPAEQVDRVVDLFEALKPFVGLDGTPRGSWPVADGVTLAVTAGGAGPTISVAVDPTVWLGGAGRAPFAAGVSLGLTIPSSGSPTPAVELYLGLPEQTPTAQHRRAIHVVVDGELRVFLRPPTGDDIPLYPDASGLGRLLEAAAIDFLLPMALDALARLAGSAERAQVAALVAAVGRGLDLVVDAGASPVTFDGSKLQALAADPAAHLAAQAGALVTQAVAALDPLLSQLPGTPHAVLDSSGHLVVTVRGVTLTVVPSPLELSIAGAASGIPILGTASASFSADASGLTGWGFGIGPALFELGGPKLRPFVRGARGGTAGWELALGLGLDDLAPAADTHKELFARWQEASGLAVVARTRTGASDTDETDAGRVALFAADAVLELLGNWVVALDDISNLLDRTVGTKQVRAILQGSILDETNDHRLRPAPVSSLPGTLFALSRELVTDLPALHLGPFDLKLEKNPVTHAVGLNLNVADAAHGLALNPGGDVVVSLVTDASWIEPPSGVTPDAGIVVDVLTIGDGPNPTVTVTPGIAANGVGIRIAKGSGPLLDAGLRIDAVDVFLFGSLTPKTGGVAVSGGIEVQLEGLAVPLGAGGGDNQVAQGVMHDAGGSGSPPTPKFSPALAIQSHDPGNGVAVSLRAGSGDGPWYLPIQRAFGPVYLDQIGLGTGYTGSPPTSPRKLDWVSVSLDGSVSLFGITASVDKLRLTYHVNKPFFDVHSWEVDLDGFAISSSIGGLTLAGALRREPLAAPLIGVEYLGMLKIGYGGYGVDLFGGYAHPTGPQGDFASFFAFGALHAPLGGPPAFFITGIGLGLGINRELTTPTIDSLPTNPFLVAMKALGPAPDPKTQLDTMRATILPRQGTYWVAAGISFTSFVLITGEVVVTVEFGDGLDIAVLGLARAELPAASLTLVSIELALLARFSTKEGLLLVQAQLTENSWLLTRSVRLTGGFAFATWWKGPNAGQFVVTIGGYHPKFHHDGYPIVPRLGLRWQPIDQITIIGESYFALCSEALMAGVKVDAHAEFGPAHARLTFGCDGIVFFDPFWFDVSAYAEISAGVRLWLLFGTVDIEVSLGAYVEVTGPPIFMQGHIEICGCEIPFEIGDQGNPEDQALDNTAFRDKYLRASSDAQVIQSAVLKGAVASGRKGDGSQQKVPDGSAANPFLVIPEFQLVLITTAPAIDMALTHDGASKTLRVEAPGVGVAPMYSHTLASSFHAELDKTDAPTAMDLTKVTIAPRDSASFPKGVWGEAPNPHAPAVPAGETVDASDGFTLDTSLGDFVGAPAVDYHQVELPFGGRKPLPFVTSRASTDARVASVAALRAVADAIRPPAAALAERFEVAAKLLAAGGYGAVGVAALRGERTAVPSFGSLADDLVAAPDAASPPVEGVVVDRGRPPKPFVRPSVKAVSGVPFTLGTQALLRTTVADARASLSRPPPTIDGVRAALAGRSSAALFVRPAVAPAAAPLHSVPRAGSAPPVHGTGTAAAARMPPPPPTVFARTQVPATRIATGPLSAVANARPDRLGAQRLTRMTDELAQGTTVHEGEVVVIGLGTRGTEKQPDRLAVRGGPTRILALAAGGNVLFDSVAGADLKRGAESAELAVPAKAERVIVAALGSAAGHGGALDGWYAGQSLPLIGWDMALGAGTVVTFHRHRVRANRERRDGGYANTRALAAESAHVATRFDAPVTAVAIAIDDAAATAGDAATALGMRLVGAARALGADGQPEPPSILVQGVRTILVYAVVPDAPERRAHANRARARAGLKELDPNVLVVVDGARRGHLAGVAGTTGSVPELLKTMARAGFDAAIRAPLLGGTGSRTVVWTSAHRSADRS